MRHQLQVGPDQPGRPRPGERAAAPAEQAPSGAAGVAGLSWLWELVEFRLAEAGPGHTV